MGVTTIHRRLPPALAARVVAVTLLVIVGAAVPTSWIVSIGFVGHVPFVGAGFQWCAKAFGVHHRCRRGSDFRLLLWWSSGRFAQHVFSGRTRRLRQDRGTMMTSPTTDDRSPTRCQGPVATWWCRPGLLDLLDDQEVRCRVGPRSRPPAISTRPLPVDLASCVGVDSRLKTVDPRLELSLSGGPTSTPQTTTATVSSWPTPSVKSLCGHRARRSAELRRARCRRSLSRRYSSPPWMAHATHSCSRRASVFSRRPCLLVCRCTTWSAS